MKRTVQIYIEGIAGSNNYELIELFKDEAINTSLSVQNINDISKMYTDFTQSFTVPCSRINDPIFKHFYNSDVDDTTVDNRLRRNAFIEIDHTPFRNGRIQLEGSNIKKNSQEFYTITFYGDALSLKDLIGDAKLRDLDFSAITIPTTGSEINNRITSTTDYDIRYPLISSKRLWSYGDGTSTDISTGAGKIVYNELFPALKIARIFEAIEAYTGVDFKGVFLTQKRFTNCFLYLKNTEENTADLQSKPVDFISTNNSTDFNVVTNDMLVLHQGVTPTFLGAAVSFGGTHTITARITNVSIPSAIYTLECYVNGVLFTTRTGTGTPVTLDALEFNNSVGLDEIVSFRIRANQPISLDITINYTKFLPFISTSYTTYYTYSYAVAQTVTTTDQVDTAMLMPDMKVIDFLTGIFKEFNLTCYALSVDTFQVEPLDDWYSKGRILDITTYTDVDNIAVDRIKLYKSITFEHEKSQSLINTAFASAFGREYGSLNQVFQFDGEDYQIKVPFENLLMSKFTGTNLQVGYCVTNYPDYKAYVPKPVLLYMNEQTACDFDFYNGVSTSTIVNYMPFGQDMKESTLNYSLNFGSDTSTFYNEPVNNSLYNTYYSGYLGNLYNQKNRITKVKCMFPISFITSLRLNDRLIIRDRRYIINEINTDITKGEVNLVLINDFRKINSQLILKPTKEPGSIKVPVLIKNKGKEVLISTNTAGVTLSTASVTEDTLVTVTYPINPKVKSRLKGEDGNTLIGEHMGKIYSEIGKVQAIDIVMDTTNLDGTTEQEILFIEQGA